MKRMTASLSLRGFTLVELMISLAVIMILTFILMSRYPETSVRLMLANTSHTLSLLIREAQVRGSAVDSVNSTIGGYGVYVSMANQSQFILFGDTVDAAIPKPYGITIGNGLFESGSPFNETKSVTTLPSRYVISRLCTGTGFPFSCTGVDSLTVSFTRPDPMPSIYINNTKTTPANGACIELHSPRAPLSGHIRNVQVFGSGMIRPALGKCDNS